MQYMLKSSMKQNFTILSRCRWPATNQKFSKTEGSFENWTTLRWKKGYERYDRHSSWPVHCKLNHYTPCLQ